jgi:hypothetical protein
MQVDFDEEGETEHNLHLTANAHAHYEHSGPGGGPAYTPFRHPGGGVPAIDPGLDQSTAANRNVHTPMSAAPHQAPHNHLLQPDNAGHLSHSFYGDMRSSQTPPASANASPRFSAISPTSQPRQVTTHYVPEDRNPPPRDVSDETINDAYAAFILYCNPHFPTVIDTTELVKLFRTPPKSDGNAFSTWALFELIRKFDAKEIKTWTQLALDLGVKPPNTDEGQSTQKVQQYSVRLKVRFFTSFIFLMSGKRPFYFFPLHWCSRLFLCSNNVFMHVIRLVRRSPTRLNVSKNHQAGSGRSMRTEPLTIWDSIEVWNAVDECGLLRPSLLCCKSEGTRCITFSISSSTSQDSILSLISSLQFHCRRRHGAVLTTCSDGCAPCTSTPSSSIC